MLVDGDRRGHPQLAAVGDQPRRDGVEAGCRRLVGAPRVEAQVVGAVGVEGVQRDGVEAVGLGSRRSARPAVAAGPPGDAHAAVGELRRLVEDELAVVDAVFVAPNAVGVPSALRTATNVRWSLAGAPGRRGPAGDRDAAVGVDGDARRMGVPAANGELRLADQVPSIEPDGFQRVSTTSSSPAVDDRAEHEQTVIGRRRSPRPWRRRPGRAGPSPRRRSPNVPSGDPSAWRRRHEDVVVCHRSSSAVPISRTRSSAGVGRRRRHLGGDQRALRQDAGRGVRRSARSGDRLGAGEAAWAAWGPSVSPAATTAVARRRRTSPPARPS